MGRDPVLQPPPPPRPAAVEEWPLVCIPRLECMVNEELAPSELCIVRRTHSMGNLEERLQFAMVAYAGGAWHDITSEFIREAITVVVGIEIEWTYIHSFRPMDFLVIFTRQDHRNLVTARHVIEHRGICVLFSQWKCQAQAAHPASSFKVELVLEGIPLHAWDHGVAEDLLDSSCLVDTVVPKTYTSSAAFKLCASTAAPGGVPSLRWLAIPNPGLVVPLFEPTLLQHKVLIHIDKQAANSNGNTTSSTSSDRELGKGGEQQRRSEATTRRSRRGAARGRCGRRRPDHGGRRWSGTGGNWRRLGGAPAGKTSGNAWSRARGARGGPQGPGGLGGGTENGRRARDEARGQGGGQLEAMAAREWGSYWRGAARPGHLGQGIGEHVWQGEERLATG
ncbi:hypothetical protein D1007_07122 [Hordeum vulgare]|nr:hypothetical protein D1007_07122 [Hordeum vulgare]